MKNVLQMWLKIAKDDAKEEINMEELDMTVEETTEIEDEEIGVTEIYNEAIRSSATSKSKIPSWLESTTPVRRSLIRRTCQFSECTKGEDGGAYKTMKNLASKELVLDNMEASLLEVATT